MSGNTMMAAIGNIDDRYVMEFAEVMPLKKPTASIVKWFLPLAGCLSAACLALILLPVIRGGGQNNPPHIYVPGTTVPFTNEATVPGTMPPTVTDDATPGKVIWGTAGPGDFSGDNYEDTAEKGKIVIAKELREAMRTSSNKKDLFAVRVKEMPGTPLDYVYDTFVKPLGVEESFMEKGILFMTADQIAAAECPSDFWLIFYLAVNPEDDRLYEDIPITPEYLEKIPGETRTILVWYRTWTDANVDGKEAARKAIEQIRNEIFSDYGITEDMVVYYRKLIPLFVVKLGVTEIADLLEDPRVGLVLDWEHVDDKGEDFS